MANVTIDIASEFRGKPAFDKAGKSVSSLEKSVGKLGKQLAGVFAAQKIYAFGKASVKAFEEDQKSAALLSNTMKNLGLQFANPAVEEFIGKLSQAAGIADDQLRPAMQKLLQVTGSVVKSQEILKNAIDISRGSGVDFETVVSDLSNAFVGNNKGLKKYAIGLTQAELKTASFDTVMQQFNKNFSGANAAYLNTYAGQMEKLTVAAGEAKETIGKGLIDAFKILAGDNSIGSLSDKMATLATNIADFFRGLAQGFKDLANMPVIKQLLQLAGVMLKIAGKVAGAVIDPFVKSGARSRSSALAPASANSFLTEHMAAANAAKAAKAEADAKKRAQAILKAQQANTKALKDQSLIKKQSALFDLQQIELVAALKGKLSEEDRKRVELQLALLQGNEEEATKLSTQIANSIDKTGNLAKYLQTLPDANNPFKNWTSYLDAIEAQAARIAAMGGGGGSTTPPSTNVQPDFTKGYTGTGTGQGSSIFDTYQPTGGSQQVIVQIDGKTIASTLMDQSLSGNQSYVDRRTGGFNW